ncbi:MAG: 2-C-methyl-D-erythritol 4-phosphate cytidylyltransferase [Aquificae bacterium]|nr:2-C-methyl-D-erythritol 4-phosphate cytidylyltransferase [Aquificota bacterium]
MKVVAVLLAGGSGSRFGGKKQFFKIKGEPIFQYSVNTVNKIDVISEIILVLPPQDLDRVKVFSFKKVSKVAGGKERQFSVYNALKNIDSCDVVVIHDTARPFATEEMFLQGIENIKKGWDGSITAYKSRDTVKEVEGDKVIQTLNRERLYIVQTPQTFVFPKLLEAHNRAKEDGVIGTDDSFLMERLGYRITVNEGSPLNIKITTREDLQLANCIAKLT